MAKSEYKHPGRSVDMDLTEDELCTLIIALKEALQRHGIRMMHEEIIEDKNKGDYHPKSHIATLVSLYRRVDAAYFGRKTWNRGRE